MNDVAKQALSKVPADTLGFWVVKILATTLGETGGDTVTMTLNWGYLAGVALFGGVLVALVSRRSPPSASIRSSTGRRSSPLRRSAHVGRLRRPIARDRLRRRIASAAVLSVGHPRPVALVRGNGVGKYRLDAESRGVLLGHDHVFPDPGHRSRRLARRHSRIWLRTRRAGIHRGSRSGRSPVLLDRCLACHLVLGRVHPDAASGRNRGGLH